MPHVRPQPHLRIIIYLPLPSIYMGWSGGSGLMDNVIETLNSNVKSKAKRKEIYAELIDAFENEDADTLDECLGTDDAFDEAYEGIHGEICDDCGMPEEECECDRCPNCNEKL